MTTTTWFDCDEGATVELVAVEGAGHTWFASELGPVDGAVDATDHIVDYFDLAN